MSGLPGREVVDNVAAGEWYSMGVISAGSKLSNKWPEWDAWQAKVVEVAVAAVSLGTWRVLEALAKVDGRTDQKLNNIHDGVVLQAGLHADSSKRDL